MQSFYHCSRLSLPPMLIAALLLLATARADDTELFVTPAATDPDAQTNILFIIDTSGSMDTRVLTQAAWDPAVQFEGCYRRDALYVTSGSTPPPCDSQAFVAKSVNRCAAASVSLDRRGQFRGAVLGWNPSTQRWETLADTAAADDATDVSGPQYLECAADRGVHGDGSASASYAANGPDAGPWLSDASREPGWNTAQTLFDGNWLNWRSQPPSVERSRLEIVQSVVNDLLLDLNNVNVGLMHFNDAEGGPVVQALTDIGVSREAMRIAVSGLVASGATPLSETLYEATAYFRGGPVDFGNVGPIPSVAAARTGQAADAATYRSPISDGCQQNFIIYLTDGEPFRDENADDRIRGLPGFSELVGDCDGSGEGRCLDDLAEYLYEADAGLDVEGTQNVVTYTIGFDIDIPLLADTARRGGGRYYLADDTGSLTSALTDLLASIEQRAASFVSPSIPVSAFNRSATEREVYVALFEPTNTAHWPGNVKKYRFAGGTLFDRFGEPAIDPATGFFEGGITSFWSPLADGSDVRAGGAASLIPDSGARQVYTDLAGPELTASGNRVESANEALTPAMLGVAPEQRDALLRWIRGDDVADLDADGDNGEARRQMGDPLHVRPVTLSYGESADDPQTMVYVTTNDGLLQAIDAASGIERWAFLPSRLLPLQQGLRLDEPVSQKRYGLDGEIRLVFRNLDGRPGVSGADQAVLVFGMGRGGRAVYAIDVTAPDSPRLLWQIDSHSPGFSSLGQIWAAAPATRMNVGGTVHDVIVLGGGYDDGQDNRGYRRDSIGNALYLIDLQTGERLWSAGEADLGHDLVLEDMTHSMPAAPRVLDLSGDGLADRLYVGDTAARLWRIDFINGNAAGSLAEGGVLASLGGAALADPASADVRRFHATPDVVFVTCPRGNHLAINIGSGYRGHPLDTEADDAFFSIRDPLPFGVRDSADYDDPAGIGDLQDITTDADAEVAEDAAGWLLRLNQEAGEKVLSSAVTFDNSVFFNSFAPGSTTNACRGAIGINRAYQVNACSGQPLTNLDASVDAETLTVEDRALQLKQAGIAPDPMFLFPSTLSEGPVRCVGLECFPPQPGQRSLRRTFWTPGR